MKNTMIPGQFRMDFRLPDTRDLADRYREASLTGWPGACPIEAGYLGSLVDHECPHQSLPGDQVINCRCWG